MVVACPDSYDHATGKRIASGKAPCDLGRHACRRQDDGMRPLITTATLAASIDAPSAERPTLLDTRFRLMGPPGADAYREVHLPGAVFVDMDTELAGEPG